MFFDLLLIFLCLFCFFTVIIRRNYSKFVKLADQKKNLKEVKLLVLVWQALVKKKNCWIIWFSKEHCLESNGNIWERKKNLLTEAKLEESKSSQIDSYMDC